MTTTGAEGLLTIGAFSLRCGLSITALRRYDEAGLLPAAVVDPSSGYRYYSPHQGRTKHLVRLLRTLDVPVATIAALLADPATAADRLEQHWSQVERWARRRRAGAFLLRALGGSESTVFDVETRDVPEQTRYPAILGAYDAVAEWASARDRELSGPPWEIMRDAERIEVAWLLHEG